MFVPVITDFLPEKEGDSLWFFYAYLAPSKEYGWPVIAPHYYFDDPASWVEKGREEPIEGEWTNYYLYPPPHRSDLDKIKQIPIPDSIYEDCAEQEGSYTDASITIHSKRWQPLYDWIYAEFEKLAKIEPIEAIIMLSHVPAIFDAAKDLGIKVLHTEWSPVRPPVYQRMSYLDFTDLGSDVTDCQIRWERFKKIKDKLPLFSRKALLAMVLSDEHLPMIDCLEWGPDYEIGIVGHEANHPILLRYNHLGNADMLAKAISVYDKSEILFRNRPRGDVYRTPKGITVNTQMLPVEFISHCRRVVCVSSNMGFETMLWGRSSYILNPNPVRFMANTDIADKSLNVVDELFINYFLIGYLVSYERLLDSKYLKWRLTMPTEEEIYRDNLAYLSAKIQINLFKTGEITADAILRSRGRNAHGVEMQDGASEDSDGEIKSSEEIKKVWITCENRQKRLRILGVNEGTFSFGIGCPWDSSEVELTFETAQGAVIELNVTSQTGSGILVEAMNALPDKISFAEGNPRFKITFSETVGQVWVEGKYVEKEADQLAAKWYAEAWAKETGLLWEANHNLEDKSLEVAKLLEDRELLLLRIQTLESRVESLELQIKNLKSQEESMELQIGCLNLQVTNLELEKTQLLEVKQKLEIDAGAAQQQEKALETEIVELNGRVEAAEERHSALIERLRNHRIKSSAQVLFGRI